MRLSRSIGFLACAGMVLAGATARADSEQSVAPAAVSSREPFVPSTTVLLSSSLLNPFVEVSVEQRVAPWLGVAVVAGGGWSDAKPKGGNFYLVPTYDFGAQVRAHQIVAGWRGATSD